MIGGGNTNSFGKTICSICYEDLNPIIDDLQSISICGHVFHELCLQQWFGYCTNGKKKNCPVCKQSCSEQNAIRLYFQSIGDPNDTGLNQKPRDYEEDPREFRNEVKSLQRKVLGLTSTLEQQSKDLKEVNAKLFTCKEELKMEVTLKNEAVKQKAAFQQLLHHKSEELDRSTLECIRLQDRNLALAEELVALKLSYEELLTNCGTLGRREARSLNKLQKAKEKINKLKAKVQELETALEEKDKEVLSTLRASKKNCDLRQGSKEPKVDRCSYENQNKAPAETEEDFRMVTGSCDDISRSRKKRKYKSKDRTLQTITEDIIASSLHQDNHVKESSVRNKDGGASDTSTYMHEVSYKNLGQSFDYKKAVYDCVLSRPESAFEATGGSQVQRLGNKDGISGSRSCSKSSTVNTPPVIIIDDDTDLLPLDDIRQRRPSFHIRKETSAPVILAQPGDSCFSGGLLGPDGTKWHLGKWCKKVKDKGSGSLSGRLQGSGAQVI